MDPSITTSLSQRERGERDFKREGERVKSERSIKRERERELFLLLTCKLVCGPIYHNFFITERDREGGRKSERSIERESFSYFCPVNSSVDPSITTSLSQRERGERDFKREGERVKSERSIKRERERELFLLVQ